MTVGERIRQRRLELELTQEELAKKLGYSSRTAISNVEKGKEDLTTTRVRKFAEALNVTPAYLMGWEDKPSPSPELIKLASQYKSDVVFSHDLSEIEYDTAKSDDAILAYANKFKELLELASNFNDKGIDDLTKYAKLMSKSEEYKKEE